MHVKLLNRRNGRRGGARKKHSVLSQKGSPILYLLPVLSTDATADFLLIGGSKRLLAGWQKASV